MAILLILCVLYVLTLPPKEEKKMKKPENFTDIINLQKDLDKKIINYRPRRLKDIKKSLIAELIEFDEESIDSHKTWKTKKRDKSKELEELTDVWFFVAQLINYAYDIGDITLLELKSLDTFFMENNYNFVGDIDVLTVVNDLRTPVMTYEWLRVIVRDLKCLSLNYGYNSNDLLDCYWFKWNKNINRINSEWN